MARKTSAFCLILVMTTFITINAQGLHSNYSRNNAFFNFITNRLDIISLQETHWTSELETKIKSECNGTNNSRGVAILINSRLDYNVIPVISDNEGRVLNVTLDLDERILNIVNIYAPQTDSDEEFSPQIWMALFLKNMIISSEVTLIAS